MAFCNVCFKLFAKIQWVVVHNLFQRFNVNVLSCSSRWSRGGSAVLCSPTATAQLTNVSCSYAEPLQYTAASRCRYKQIRVLATMQSASPHRRRIRLGFESTTLVSFCVNLYVLFFRWFVLFGISWKKNYFFELYLWSWSLI